jgi:hypothetical protein
MSTAFTPIHDKLDELARDFELATIGEGVGIEHRNLKSDCNAALEAIQHAEALVRELDEALGEKVEADKSGGNSVDGVFYERL